MKMRENTTGRAPALPIVLKWQQRDEEGYAPSSSRQKGKKNTTKRKGEHDGEGASPPHRGIATTRRGGCPPPRCVIGTTWERAPPFPCVAPVRVVRTFFLKKGKFAGAPCTPPLNLLDRLVLVVSWSWRSGHGCRRVWGWVVVGEEETKKN